MFMQSLNKWLDVSDFAGTWEKYIPNSFHNAKVLGFIQWKHKDFFDEPADIYLLKIKKTF